jgi:branched-chain amino acid transport system permease protein
LKKNILIFIVFLLIAFVLPFVLSVYGIDLVSEIFIMAIFAMSLGLIMGYAGMVSLGHAGFFGIGAYTVALLGPHIPNSYLLLFFSICLSGLLALVTGAIFIRTSKFYFLMITLAFGQLLFALAWQLKQWTGGADGMKVSAPLNLGFGEIVSPIGIYSVMAAAFIIVYLLLRFFVESPVGKIVKGIMENEARMSALGYDVRIYKLLTYTFSGALAGFAGSLYGFYNLFVSPDVSSWMFSGQVMMMVIIGGVGTLIGPAIGAGLFIFLQNFISTYTERWPIIMGALLVILVLVGKGGIIHWFALLKSKIFYKKRKNIDDYAPQHVEKEEVVN